MNQSQLLPMLTKVADLFVKQMAQKVRQVGAPKNIISSTSIYPPITTSDGASIAVAISLAGAPAAGAYEWGSGIHATKGKKEKYRIPKLGGGSFVAFPAERWPGHWLPPGQTSFVFTSVQHPGVKARPYIAPTIEENKAEYRQILGQEFKAEILRGVEKITVIRG